jgi:hypothetical protein
MKKLQHILILVLAVSIAHAQNKQAEAFKTIQKTLHTETILR